ncbi:MAG: ferredoxin [Candidatus Moranbacteria bacterium]|nr:ferredoxin [Candidatus Moranbacteria bacterium]NTW46108.1 ferredoxin [Candidatus Moranbacteria bacterium]
MDFKDASKPSGPVTLASGQTVSVNRDLCIGCGACTATAPNTFGLDGEGKSTILASADSDPKEAIENAKNGCPVGAIDTGE